MKLSTKICYGYGAVASNFVYAFVAGFLMYYYNEVLGISSIFIGTLFMVARIFDAFNDPIMGIIVSKTKSRFGRFRPWILSGIVMNSLVIVIMFNLPIFENHTTLLVMSSVMYILWGMTYTVMDIPFWSLIPVLTNDMKERETISVIARSCAGLGYAVISTATLLLVKVLGSGNEHVGFGYLSIIVALCFTLSGVILFLKVEEKSSENIKTHTVKEMFQMLIKNDQALIIVVAIVVFNASLFLTQNLAIYFFKYDIKNADLFGVFSAIGGAFQILAMMSLPTLRKRFSRRQIFTGALVLTIIGYIGLFMLPALGIKSIVPLCVMASIIFAGFGLATVLTTIFLSDCVDYGEWTRKNFQMGWLD